MGYPVYYLKLLRNVFKAKIGVEHFHVSCKRDISTCHVDSEVFQSFALFA